MAPQDLFPIFSTDLKAKFMVLGVHELLRHLPLPGNLCVYTRPNPEEGLEGRDFWLAIEQVCGARNRYVGLTLGMDPVQCRCHSRGAHSRACNLALNAGHSSWQCFENSPFFHFVSVKAGLPKSKGMLAQSYEPHSTPCPPCHWRKGVLSPGCPTPNIVQPRTKHGGHWWVLKRSLPWS